MSVIPSASHRFREVFGEDASRVFRITYRDGDILRMHSFYIVDPSIYSISDQWTATLVEQVHTKSHRRHRPGTGIDFVESDIVEIYDETLERSVHVA
jgi:hypothetical protein